MTQFDLTVILLVVTIFCLVAGCAIREKVSSGFFIASIMAFASLLLFDVHTGVFVLVALALVLFGFASKNREDE